MYERLDSLKNAREQWRVAVYVATTPIEEHYRTAYYEVITDAIMQRTKI
jgi:hypothetical protein